VAYMPPRHCGGCLSTARSWAEPTTWCGSSLPCSTPTTRPCCRTGSITSRPLASLPWPARPRPCARISTQSCAVQLRRQRNRSTDLKLQKRITAGRAGVPLLRHRVVLMAGLRRRYS
jgi:hypothetical protein